MTFICRTQDQAAADQQCRQPDAIVLYRIEPGDWPVQGEALRDLVARGAAIWHGVSRLVFREAGSGEQPDVVLRACQIDGRGSVLAWSELPCPWRPPVQQCYDVREAWSWGREPETGKVWLPLVIAHELGHAVGLPHGPSGNIMAPSYGQMSVQPGEWDRRELVARYGEAESPIPPEGPGMNKVLQCLLKVLPEFLTCIFTAQAEAIQRGEPGPLEEILAFIAQARRRLESDSGQQDQG